MTSIDVFSCSICASKFTGVPEMRSGDKCPQCQVGVVRPVGNEKVRSEVLRTAEELINGERAKTYGDAGESFDRIGKLWGATLGTDPIPGWKVALCLAQLKIARAIAGPTHLDSWYDLAGYAALGAEIAQPATNFTERNTA